MYNQVGDIDRIVFSDAGSGIGCIWIIGWLFTIGYLKLSFWRGVLAFFIWPYFIGKKFFDHKRS